MIPWYISDSTVRIAGTVKTLLVDDSQVVANLMVVICTKIGITNYDEYGLVSQPL